jgi:hypothetical protein
MPAGRVSKTERIDDMDERNTIRQNAAGKSQEVRDEVEYMLGATGGLGAALGATLYILIAAMPPSHREVALREHLRRARAEIGKVVGDGEEPDRYVLGVAAAQDALERTHAEVRRRLIAEGRLG